MMDHILIENQQLKREISKFVGGSDEEIRELEEINKRLQKENEEQMTLLDALLAKTEAGFKIDRVHWLFFQKREIIPQSIIYGTL